MTIGLEVSSTLTIKVPVFPRNIWGYMSVHMALHSRHPNLKTRLCFSYRGLLGSGIEYFVVVSPTFLTNLLAPYLGKWTYTEDGSSRLLQNRVGVAINQKFTIKASTLLKNAIFHSCGR
jgi:hypothetical protein